MIDEKQFNTLAKMKGSNLLSIYIPTYRANHSQEDQIRYKNALKAAQGQLTQRGISEKDADHLLRPARELLEQERFWSYLSDGLAVFIGPDNFFHYEILPVTFDTYVFVGETFHLSPMLPVLGGSSRFFLLALSQNEVRFFEGDQYSITPVKIDDLVPTGGMKDAFVLSDSHDALQHHSSGRDGGENAIYHGQGIGQDDKKKDIEAYFREVNKGLMEMLYDEKPPMVVACVDFLLPIYQSVNEYGNLFTENISGNPEQLNPAMLHEKAWNIISRHFESQQAEDLNRFQAAMAKDRASAAPQQIVPAAAYEKVDTLFIKKGEHLMGQFDYDKNELTLGKRDEYRDLLDLAAVQTHLNGGRVYWLDAEEMPVPTASANAIYRFE
ncbi:hypothetical protein [Phaeodactylibacter sp.]|uniref:baeRF7 domain-containing protein n=1 Tax=Phaeodactylibacter sp. TaxID=1940289 RepID=UPI0025D6A554|nr:hypothetical protein [Phaeodactylibacter sp.]MCI4648793.1 hypothetical protein [Phaeodactylibacter sp.]MCI5092460.1 hypothetical protein [Phaeodactylibacter sp.]